MVFEDEFSNKQSDMLRLSLEYTMKLSIEVDKIYVYASHENNAYSFNTFYEKGNNIYFMRALAVEAAQNDSQLIFDVLKIGTDDLKEINEICQKYDRPMPTQMKLVYDNITKKVSGKYSYDLFYSNSDTLTSNDIFLDWYNEVKKEVEG